MATKRFFVPFQGDDPDPMKNQILKNTGYFTISLNSVQYRAKGSFFQKLFGGKNDVALVSSVSYAMSDQVIVAKSIQDKRTVNVKKDETIPFGIAKPVALTVPTIAGAVQLDITLTIVKNDNLGQALNMLNSDEFKKPLELAPKAVGEILSITNMVKKLFSDTSPHDETKSTYAGLIHVNPDKNPVERQCLVSGYIVAVSNDDSNDLDFKRMTDAAKFSIKQNSVDYDGTEIKETCLVYSITYQPLKGDDQNSNWYKKYNNAIGHLEDIRSEKDKTKIESIHMDSLKMWTDGNTLLDADESYVNGERVNIKAAAIKSINDKYIELTQPPSPPPSSPSSSPKPPLPPYTPQSPSLSIDILKGLTGSTSFNTIIDALPATGNYLNQNLALKGTKPIKSNSFKKLSITNEKLSQLLDKDTAKYLKQLSKSKITWNLGKQ